LSVTSEKHSGAGRRDDGRHFWREQSHRQSHLQDSLESLGPVVAHPLACPDGSVVVQTDQGLTEMIEHLRAAGSFAFDSEFIGERSYTPHLCLVQVATTRKIYVVDPLSSLDLSPFWELIVSPELQKIVLAGQQDFGPGVLRTGKPPANVMDAQIAAGFIRVYYPLSLVRLVQEFLGISLGKALTFTHWDNRPLSAVQMRYAADDVRYLPAAWDVISRQLAELGRGAWAQQECDEALGDMSLYVTPPELLYQRVRGQDRLRPRNLAILRELAIVRDQAARQEDLPTRTFLKDSILVAMARYPAKTPADLDCIKGLPRPVESKYGRQFVEATAKAMALPEDHLPPWGPKPSNRHQSGTDEAWARFSQFCQERSIAPTLVSSPRDLARACRLLADDQPLDHRLFQGWRQELLGDLLRKS
jgi:ribonuclease D